MASKEVCHEQLAAVVERIDYTGELLGVLADKHGLWEQTQGEQAKLQKESEAGATLDERKGYLHEVL